MWNLINSFPRQIAYPDRKTVFNKQEFIDVLNKNNGYKRKIYYSIYNCDAEGHFDNSNINIIGFDLDSDNKIECLKKMHEYGKLHNYKHLMLFSTNGFWIYFKTKNGENLTFPKEALLNAHKFLIKENDLTAYERNEKGEIDPYINDVDFHILGDVARVSRCPLSYDTKRKRYCIPITEEDLNKGFDYITEKSKQPVFDFVWYGTEEFDIKPYDYSNEIKRELINIPDGNYNLESMENKLFKGVFPCVSEWITECDKAVYKARYYAVIWLHDMGFPKSFTWDLLRKYYSDYPRTDGYKNNWEHMERVRVINTVYDSNKETFFPRCETLWEEGLCPGKCKYYNTVYKCEKR